MMGTSSSKTIDFHKNLYIIFDLYQDVNYKTSKETIAVEKNIYYKKYIKKKIIECFKKITNTKIIIPDSRFVIQFKIDEKENIIFYEINMQIEFDQIQENKNIEMPLVSSLMSNIIIENLHTHNITFELLEKTILNVFMLDIVNKKKIKTDNENYIYLNYDSIKNISIYQK